MPSNTNEPSSGQEHSHLPPREREILQLIAAGLSNKEIASELRLSRSTVKAYVEDILRRTGSRNRTEAAVRGLAEPSEDDERANG
jgi:DNA-binding NarL/FixJ family response regulator